MNNTVRRTLLETVNKHYDTFKILLLTDNVFELPKHIYEQPSVLLDAGNKLGLPTFIFFYPRYFYMRASFNKVIYDLKIPYNNLLGIWDYDRTEGVVFTTIQPLPPVAVSKSKLRAVN